MNEFFESLRCDARRPLLLSIRLCEKETIMNYQDRLGTNERNVEVKGAFHTQDREHERIRQQPCAEMK